MTKNLALAASITMLIAISGQAFADTASPNARYWSNATTLPTGKWSTPSMLSIRQWPHSRPSPMRTATMADRNRTIEDTDPRQFVQGRLDLSGRRFLRLRFVAQECGLGHARVYKRDIGIGRPRPGPCAHIIRLGFTRAQLAKIGLPYQSGKIAGRYRWACARKPRSRPEWGSIGTIASTPTWR